MHSSVLKIAILAALLSGCATSLPPGLGWTVPETGPTSLPLPPAPPAPEPIITPVSRDPAPRSTRPSRARAERRLPVIERVKSLECSAPRIENGRRYKAVCR